MISQDQHLTRNFIASASSINPKVTFTVLSHPPLLGSDFSIDGKKANKEKGKANPTPKPSMPSTGAMLTPWVDVLPSNVPTMGPVQLKLTITNVKRHKKDTDQATFSRFFICFICPAIWKRNIKCAKK